MAEAKDYIRESRRIDSLRIVSITGGEPFLFYDRVIELVSFAGSLGLQSEIVTNSFWAESYDLALQVLSDLQRQGLVNFVTSLDEFHSEFVSIKNLGNAVRAAVSLGLQVTVKTLETEQSDILSENMSGLLGVHHTAKNLSLSIGSPVPEGRAKLWRKKGVGRPSERADCSGRCDKIIRFPAINPRGVVHPCCSFGERARIAGSARETPLYDILVNMQHNLLFNMIAHAGPAKVWEMASGSMPGPAAFGSACEVCNALYYDSEARTNLTRLLEKLASETHPVGLALHQPTLP